MVMYSIIHLYMKKCRGGSSDKQNFHGLCLKRRMVAQCAGAGKRQCEVATLQTIYVYLKPKIGFH